MTISASVEIAQEVALARAKSTVDGREIEFLDGLLPNLYPLAREGDKDAATLVLKVLALRLQYRRQRIAEDD